MYHMYHDYIKLETWLRAFTIFTNALFYPLIVLMVFALIAAIIAVIHKKALPDMRIRMLVSAFALTFILQMLIFFTIKYERRYLAFFVFLSTLVAVPGFFMMIKLFKHFLPAIKTKTIVFVLLFTAAAIGGGKTLIPGMNKVWLHDIPAEIRAICGKDGKPVLLTNISDERYAYYADAVYTKMTLAYDGEKEYVKFFQEGNSIDIIPAGQREEKGIIARRGNCEYYGAWVALDGFGRGLKYLNENVARLGGDNVFILVDITDAEFKKILAKQLDINKLNFRLIKEFRYARKRPQHFALYRGISQKIDTNIQNDGKTTEKR